MTEPMDDDTREYTCSYPHQGARWVLSVHADSPEDAAARLRAIGAWGRVDGVLVARIPVPAGSMVRRAWRWITGAAQETTDGP